MLLVSVFYLRIKVVNIIFNLTDALGVAKEVQLSIKEILVMPLGQRIILHFNSTTNLWMNLLVVWVAS